MRYKDNKKSYMDAYYEANGVRIRESGRKRNRAFKVKCIATKGGCCEACGLKYDGENAAVFEFHHRDPTTKVDRLSTMAPKPWGTVVDELDKCDMLCANCHNLMHAGRY